MNKFIIGVFIVLLRLACMTKKKKNTPYTYIDKKSGREFIDFEQNENIWDGESNDSDSVWYLPG